VSFVSFVVDRIGLSASLLSAEFPSEPLAGRCRPS
jgi:hypothetical protein